MREEIRNALDNELSVERKRIFASVALLAFIAAIFGAMFYPISFETVYGITKAYTAEQTEMGSKERITVQLESGESVLAKFPQHLVYQKRKKVKLTEGRALLGRRSYSVIQYAE